MQFHIARCYAIAMCCHTVELFILWYFKHQTSMVLYFEFVDTKMYAIIKQFSYTMTGPLDEIQLQKMCSNICSVDGQRA